ncbi:tetratricopeptide repeat protein [Pseudothermotoga thermarum]|uniref:Tetratricopeptide TPR_1 repeat-containing protein n=1 Tax=Pseudothermotoga thermarum DSM 5069 TaxID=688269 RepID=F7YTD8_9THEM|nr:tetratricopeptide repeat protein [Pseudothermotoga thermarum]AEH50116.1 Tetratricopeptide TPR_1 repeat-containing protein [Pseudothermotoga thermarum DSM 5069]
MERVIDLIVKDRVVEVTTDTPFVIMLRDLMYEGDWSTMKEDLSKKEQIVKEIENCQFLEKNVGILCSFVYDPVCFEELLEWLEEKNIHPKDFVHASLNGLYDLAISYADKDMHDVAFKVIKYILEVDKNYAPAYELWGSLLLEKGEFQEGIKYLDKAIEIDPWLVEAYSSLGEAYYNLGDYAKAAFYWEREIEYAPNNKFTYFMVADAYRKLNRYDKVCEILEKFLENDPNSIVAMYELAEAYKKLGDIERSKQLEERILKSQPTHGGDLEIWSLVQLRHGNYELVQRELEKVLQQSPSKVHLKLILAISYLKQNKIEQARSLINEMKDQHAWYLYGKQELFKEFLTEEEMQVCGIS